MVSGVANRTVVARSSEGLSPHHSRPTPLSSNAAQFHHRIRRISVFKSHVDVIIRQSLTGGGRAGTEATPPTSRIRPRDARPSSPSGAMTNRKIEDSIYLQIRTYKDGWDGGLLGSVLARCESGRRAARSRDVPSRRARFRVRIRSREEERRIDGPRVEQDPIPSVPDGIGRGSGPLAVSAIAMRGQPPGRRRRGREMGS
jgi:hypothetical protein